MIRPGNELLCAVQELPGEPQLSRAAAAVGPRAGSFGKSRSEPGLDPALNPREGAAALAAAGPSALQSLRMYVDAPDAESQGSAPDEQGSGNGAALPGQPMGAGVLGAGSQGPAAAEEGLCEWRAPSRGADVGARVPGADGGGPAPGQAGARGGTMPSVGAGGPDGPLAAGPPSTELPDAAGAAGSESAAERQPAGPPGLQAAAAEELKGGPEPAPEALPVAAEVPVTRAADAAGSHAPSAEPGPSAASMPDELGRSGEGAMLAGGARAASVQGADRGVGSGAAPGADASGADARGEGEAAVDQAGGGQVLAEADAGARAASASAAGARDSEGGGILEARQAASDAGPEQGTCDGRFTGAAASGSPPDGSVQERMQPAAHARPEAPADESGGSGVRAPANSAAAQSMPARAAAAQAVGGGPQGASEGDLLPSAPAGAPAAQGAAIGVAAKGGETPGMHQGDLPMPPQDVRAIVAKLVPFIKVRGRGSPLPLYTPACMGAAAACTDDPEARPMWLCPVDVRELC